MGVLTRVYTGSDLVIPKDALAQMGLKPGDRVMVHPVIHLAPADLADERERITQALDAAWGVWSEDDESAFRTARREMWNTWQPRS